MIRGPEALVRELVVEIRVIDGPEMALGADLGVNRAAFGYARRIDLPCPIIGEDLGRPFRRFQPGETLWILAKGIRTAQHVFDPNEILDGDGRAEQRLQGRVGRKVYQRRNPERLAGVADEGLFDRGVVLRPPEPRHGPDRRETDRRVIGVQVVFISRETGHDQIGVENLIADPVERVEPPEAFFGILLLLGLDRLLVDLDLREQEVANLRQPFF